VALQKGRSGHLTITIHQSPEAEKKTHHIKHIITQLPRDVSLYDATSLRSPGSLPLSIVKLRIHPPQHLFGANAETRPDTASGRQPRPYIRR